MHANFCFYKLVWWLRLIFLGMAKSMKSHLYSFHFDDGGSEETAITPLSEKCNFLLLTSCRNQIWNFLHILFKYCIIQMHLFNCADLIWKLPKSKHFSNNFRSIWRKWRISWGETDFSLIHFWSTHAPKNELWKFSWKWNERNPKRRGKILFSLSSTFVYFHKGKELKSKQHMANSEVQEMGGAVLTLTGNKTKYLPQLLRHSVYIHTLRSSKYIITVPHMYATKTLINVLWKIQCSQ